eukprot:scaffold337547_cov29-Prasinocladus_malaysianus.AAC.2
MMSGATPAPFARRSEHSCRRSHALWHIVGHLHAFSSRHGLSLQLEPCPALLDIQRGIHQPWIIRARHKQILWQIPSPAGNLNFTNYNNCL